MNIYTVSFFGHRQISNPLDVDNSLVEEIRTLIRSKEYVEFLVGRNGDFDIMAASAVRRTQKGLVRKQQPCTRAAVYDKGIPQKYCRV